MIIDNCGMLFPCYFMFYYLCLIPRELSTWLLLIIREVVLGRFNIKSCSYDFFFSLFVGNYKKIAFLKI